MTKQDRLNLARLYQAAEIMGDRERIIGFNYRAAYKLLQDGLRGFLTEVVK